jgi:single-stranded-DNA-specific exonuclease
VVAAGPASLFKAEPYDYGEARRIAAALDLAEPVAVALVRRGYRTVEHAREFLEAGEEHDPFAFDGMDQVCERLLALAREGGRITVHGDYDVDGVSATAILVSTLRALGANCDWLIPDRLGGGYGLTLAGVEEMQRRGTELVVTVDCGIGSVDEVAAARAAGIEVIVTDHHTPPEVLPDCPILHPVVSGYPFSGLCAAGVAHKLAVALRMRCGERGVETVAGLRRPGDDDLDLVALATVADLVPLLGENRRLVRRGLSVLRASPRPGLRALIASAKVEAETLDERALGFRLAPRINAVGRLYRADAAVELMLTDDHDRAVAIAAELERANSERRAVEREVTGAAEAARSALPAHLDDARALVLAGEGWHPGVVGIAASRLAERHWLPTVVISLRGDSGRGSARSIPGFDLIAALEACSDHLVRFGGHRAAAGLEVERDRLEDFAAAFRTEAAARIEDAALARTENVDALVGVGRDGIGMRLAEQIERLGPFGIGNPGLRLVVPSARLDAIRPLGEGGKHSRFELISGAGRAQGVAFGINGDLSARAGEALDLSVRVEVDRWNGAVQPRVVLRDLHRPAADAPGEAEVGCSKACPCPDREWWERVGAALDAFDGTWPLASLEGTPAAGPGRELVDRRGGAAIAALAELISSGERVLALCADAGRRRELAASAADPRRFGVGPPLVACCRCGEEGLDAALGDRSEDPAAGLVLADWGALTRRPGAARGFEHVVAVDPPPFERVEALLRAGCAGAAGGSPFAAGFLHLAWGRPELELAQLCADREWQPRGAIAEIWRALPRSGEELAGAELRVALAGTGKYPRSPEVAARAVAILVELGLCEWSPDRVAPCLRVVSSERTELGRSRAHAACVARHQEATTYLQSRAPSG